MKIKVIQYLFAFLILIFLGVLISDKIILPSIVLSYDIFIQYNYIFIQLNVLEEIYEKIN